MAIVILLQLALPVGLILWLALRSPRSWTSLALHGLAVGLLVAALGLAGLWTALPWWLPSIYALAGMLAAGLALGRHRPAATLPRGREWLGAVALAGIGALGGWFTLQALAGRRIPPQPTVSLAWPLAESRYLIANGGSTSAVNSHVGTLDLSVARHRLWQGQSYGLDIVALTSAGRTADGWRPADPARYAIFGVPVLAPCDGSVVAAGDRAPDHRLPFVPQQPDPGNYVLLRCGAADVLLAHFRKGSLTVARGAVVRTGTRLGEVGNSGSSDEPHLHIHAQTRGTAAAPFSGIPLPILLAGRRLLRNDRL